MSSRFHKSIFDPTEEKIAEVKKVLENVKAMPLKTGQILDIISEEAEDYFSGMKSAEEVIGVMQNRVQLYMDEHGVKSSQALKAWESGMFCMPRFQ